MFLCIFVVSVYCLRACMCICVCVAMVLRKFACECALLFDYFRLCLSVCMCVCACLYVFL